MAKLAGMEKVDISEEALYLIARKGEGSVRDSLSLLDQMIALADEKITAELTAATLGIVDRQLFVRLLEIIAAGKTEPVFELVKELFDSGAGIEEFVNDLIDYLRNLLVQKTASDPDAFLDVSAAEKEALIKQSAYFTEADILRMIQILSEFLAELKKGYDERLFLEICLVRLTRMESSITLQEVIERLNRLAVPPTAPSTGGGTLFDNVKPAAPSGPSPGAPSPTPPEDIPMPDQPQTTKSEAPFEPGKPLNLPRVQMSWGKFLENLKRRKQMLASLLSMGQVRDVQDIKITVTFGATYSTNKQVVEKPESKSLIEETLREFYKLTVRIEFELDATQPPPVKSSQRTETNRVDADDLLEKDPDLKKVVEQIDGEIIGRRKIEE
jgi:DNA polymerase-3 subunit gamma/tau